MAAVLKWEMGAELPQNSFSVEKEGKVFGQTQLLQPLLGTPEGTKMTCTILFCTSPTLTVYSTEHFEEVDPVTMEAIMELVNNVYQALAARGKPGYLSKVQKVPLKLQPKFPLASDFVCYFHHPK